MLLRKSKKMQIFWMGVKNIGLLRSDIAIDGRAKSTRNLMPFFENPKIVLKMKKI